MNWRATDLAEDDARQQAADLNVTFNQYRQRDQAEVLIDPHSRVPAERSAYGACRPTFCHYVHLTLSALIRANISTAFSGAWRSVWIRRADPAHASVQANVLADPGVTWWGLTMVDEAIQPEPGSKVGLQLDAEAVHVWWRARGGPCSGLARMATIRRGRSGTA